MKTKLNVFLSLILISIAASVAFPPPGGGGAAGLGKVRRSVTPVSVPFEFLMDMEDTGSADGTLVTRPIATNMTSIGISLGSSVGAWRVISNAASITSTIRIEVDTTVKARGTRSMRTDYSADEVYLEFMQGTSNAVMSLGFAFYLDANWVGATFNSYNLLVWTSSTGEFMNCNMFDNPGFEFGLQTLDGLSTVITGFANQTWYWCTMKWDQGGDAEMRIYTYSAGGLGTLMGTRTMILTASYPQFIEIGREDNHGVFNPGAWVHHDDLIIDYQGTFPLSAPYAP